jgi:hypothetical protein
MTNAIEVLATENEDWGFFGTMNCRDDVVARDAWAIAFESIHAAAAIDPDAIRLFLDSRHGRHYGDSVSNFLHAGQSINDAINSATAEWMRGVGRRTASRMGCHVGAPLLVAIAIELAAE